MSEPNRKPASTNLASPMLTGRSVKVVIPLDPHELARLTAVEGQARTVLRIGLPDRSTLAADIATKSLRKAIATVRDAGPENTVAFIQGKLEGGKVIDAGLTAEVKAPKPDAEPPA